jgi:hypothetical protein
MTRRAVSTRPCHEGGASYPNAQRSGAVWWHRKVHIWDGFETNFVFQITDPSQCGGEDKICDGKAMPICYHVCSYYFFNTDARNHPTPSEIIIVSRNQGLIWNEEGDVLLEYYGHII